MRILGIDPGYGTIGFAILDIHQGKRTLVDVGVITTKPGTEFILRLKEIYEDMKALIEEYQPEQVAIEQVFFSKNVSTAIQVSEAKGVILLTVAQAGLPYKEYSPSQMKAAISGNGNADKAAIQKMVMLELGLSSPPKPDDAADALSLALTLSFELR
ncbi:MAG: crossover junction endodeoxyribonuclease RuvC [Oceanicoccus sp.]|jgi:crossover junction endodeoxyribonuclease RuvC